MKGYFLSNSFDVEEEGSGEEDFSIFVGGLVYVVDNDGGFELIGGKLGFSYKSSVNAGDFCTVIDEGASVNGFHCMQGVDQFDGDFYSSSF